MTLRKRDQKYLWHPLTQHGLQLENIPIVRAEGCVLYAEDGKSYIDGISSWYTCMYGHCHPRLINAISKQVEELHQVIFSGFTHKPAIELSEALMEILPPNQKKIFFSDNGSTSVEVAIKMAIQFFHHKEKKKTTLLAFENAFHGDTFGAMSASGLSVYNGCFEEFFITVKRIPLPTQENYLEVLECLKNLVGQNDAFAFIYEPLVQGAGRMMMYSPSYLNDILRICKQYEVLTIADEVMTGFGKTGSHFASDFVEEKPDFVCMAKSLTGGIVPMGITSCTEQVYDAFLYKEKEKAFNHAHTYSANPIGCAAALESIKLLKSNEIQKSITRISNKHQEFGNKIKHHPKVESIRQLGIIFALDLKAENASRYGNIRDLWFEFFMKHGIFLRPLGKTIYILAPFVISDRELSKIHNAIENGLNTIT